MAYVILNTKHCQCLPQRSFQIHTAVLALQFMEVDKKLFISKLWKKIPVLDGSLTFLVIFKFLQNSDVICHSNSTK